MKMESTAVPTSASQASADHPSADRYFPGSYQASRERLLAMARLWAKKVPVIIDSRAVPAHGPSGETLALDWVQFGPKNGSRQAARVLVLACGTHGLEGFCGAGVQHAVLEKCLSGGWKNGEYRPGENSEVVAETAKANGAVPGRAGELALPAVADWPDDFALVILHAVNPYGFAWLRRVNESNVDINRNSLTQFDRSKIHPDYEALYELVNPATLDPENEAARWQQIDAFIASRGERVFQQAISEGQYKYPEGVQFGGHKKEASIQHIHDLSREHLAGASKVIWIDYHTGLGELGDCELITSLPRLHPDFTQGLRVWGDALKSTESGDSLSTRLNGLMDQGLRQLMNPATQFTFVAAEYGTYPIMRMLKSIRIDNWLHHHADSAHPLWPSIKAEVLESFRPNQAIWRHRVLHEAEWHLGAAVRELGF